MARLFDLDLLRALVVIAETGSLSAAAPRLNRSQSAVSEQVRKLEDMCGVTLFDRGKTGAKLTPAGERLVGHAHELLALSDAALRDMQNAQLAGNLHLAITDYFRPTALPALLRRMRDQFPKLHLHVSIRKSAAIDEAAAEEFDIGLSMTILDPTTTPTAKSSRHIHLRQEPLVWVADKSFSIPDSGTIPLVVLPDTCSLQRFIVKALKSHGTSYEIAHSASGIGGLHMAVEAGLGVTCLNASAIPPNAVTLNALPDLPPMPDVAFRLVGPRVGEPAHISDVRNMLVDHLS
ncbi:LysR family transcriptional regulator [Thalassospira lucentensis]|uniref:LysR family transcriptional regulator n=1 Tax=Thalassospira lucentensis TaxID=168935 RepID=UPI003AA992AA